MAEDLAKFFYEVGQLKLVRRAGWWMAGVREPESVAEHSYRVAVIAYVLATLEGADPAPVVLAALFHDLAEARTTDLHRVAGRYLGAAKGPAEVAALAEALARLPAAAAGPVHAVLDPATRDPALTRLLKDADSLEMLFQGLEYRANGHSGVGEWIDGALAALQTEHARRIGAAAVAMEPTAWFAGLKQSRLAADTEHK
jgi:putative hydrolase of HD superfamily